MSKIHGESGSRLYHIWQGMKQRCNDKNCPGYVHYGAKGIKVCEYWNDYQIFSTWAKYNGYTNHLTIDRIDNQKGYSPDNCRWVDIATQNRNKTTNTKLKYMGKEKCISEWSRLLEIPLSTISNRMKRTDNVAEILNAEYDRKEQGIETMSEEEIRRLT